MIVNLSNEDKKGTHFIAIYIFRNKILYFDSFGIPLISNSVKEYLKKYDKKVFYFKYQVQHFFSTHCGFYCISIILWVENGVSDTLYFKLFDKTICI